MCEVGVVQGGPAAQRWLTGRERTLGEGMQNGVSVSAVCCGDDLRTERQIHERGNRDKV